MKFISKNSFLFFQIPKRAPNAKPTSPPLELPTAAIAENISGAPLPNARNVTPYKKNISFIVSNIRNKRTAMFSDNLRTRAITRRAGQKLKKESKYFNQ